MNFYAVKHIDSRPLTPWVVFDCRTKVVKATFTTDEEALDFAVMCQEVEDENARKRAALDHVFGPGHTL